MEKILRKSLSYYVGVACFPCKVPYNTFESCNDVPLLTQGGKIAPSICSVILEKSTALLASAEAIKLSCVVCARPVCINDTNKPFARRATDDLELLCKNCMPVCTIDGIVFLNKSSLGVAR